MFTTIRNAAFAGVLGLCLSTTAIAGEVLFPVPELTGTFTHGQAPISAIVDFGVDVEDISGVYLEVAGTGSPGTSSTLGAFPADLLVSVSHEFLGELIPPTVIGPYGESLDFFSASYLAGELTGDFNGAGGGGGGTDWCDPGGVRDCDLIQPRLYRRHHRFDRRYHKRRPVIHGRSRRM